MFQRLIDCATRCACPSLVLAALLASGSVAAQTLEEIFVNLVSERS